MGQEKDIAFGRKVRNRDILKIDECCKYLKTGSKQEGYIAQEKILELFDSYLEKYTNLFSGVGIDLSNYDTRGFLGMFLTGRSKSTANLSAQKVYIVKVMRRFTREDIKAEMTLLFLIVLQKYRIVEGVNALNPLTRIFRWRVKDWFNKIVKDPLFKTVEPKLEEDSQFNLETFIDLNFYEEPSFEEVEVRMDLQWVLSPQQNIYKSLTRYERYLISLVYQDHLSIVQVAEKLQRDKDTIKRHLRAALKKLEDRMLNAGSE